MSPLNMFIGLIVLLGLAGFLMMAMRPGRVRPRHFVDQDLDGEPDEVSEEDRAAAIEADGKPLDWKP